MYLCRAGDDRMPTDSKVVGSGKKTCKFIDRTKRRPFSQRTADMITALSMFTITYIHIHIPYREQFFQRFDTQIGIPTRYVDRQSVAFQFQYLTARTVKLCCYAKYKLAKPTTVALIINGQECPLTAQTLHTPSTQESRDFCCIIFKGIENLLEKTRHRMPARRPQ